MLTKVADDDAAHTGQAASAYTGDGSGGDQAFHTGRDSAEDRSDA